MDEDMKKKMQQMQQQNEGGGETMRLFRLLFKDYKWHLIFVFICIIVTALAMVQGTLFMQTLIDDYIVPLMNSQNPDFTQLAWALVRVGAFYALGVVCAFGNQRTMAFVTQGFLRDLRIQIFEHMETLPIRYFDNRTNGDIMSVYTNDIDTLRQLISQTLPQLVNSSVTIIVSLTSMIILTIPLTLVSLCMIALMLVISRSITRMSGRYFMQQQRSLGKANGYIEEMISGQKVVKVFNHENESVKGFREINDELKESAFQANKYANVLMPVTMQMGNMSYTICAVVGAALALGGWANITIGTLVSFLTLNRSVNNPIAQISMQLNSYAMARAGERRIFDLLDEESEDDEGIVTLCRYKMVDGEMVETKERTDLWAWRHPRPDGTIELVPMQGDIELEDVDFGYVPEKTVLHDINVYAHPGEKIAFVGSTGAGKTTIINLINRFYDIQKGFITYDGIDIKLMTKAALRKSLAVVLQDTHLFTGTVMDNIRYGRLDASDEECIEAAKLANADHFIRHLPDGYNTVLTGDGANLSQGQRQLLAIARAAVADPPALILDEATSSIDSRTEKLVQDGMDKLMEGRTTFVIAHRLSTIKNSDCIMVLEHGRIIERGTHESLMAEKGRYYQLYTGMIEME